MRLEPNGKEYWYREIQIDSKCIQYGGIEMIGNVLQRVLLLLRGSDLARLSVPFPLDNQKIGTEAKPREGEEGGVD